MRYTIVIEESPRNYAVSVPDLPGCVATGASEAEAVREISKAIRLHSGGCPAGSIKSAATDTHYPAFCNSARTPSSSSRCAFSIQRCS